MNNNKNLTGSGLLQWLTDMLRIDQNDLDSCCIRQPELFARASSELAHHASIRDQTKRQLQDEEARVDAKLRKATKDKKLTEKEIAARVRLAEGVQELSTSLIEQTYMVSRLQALKEAFEHRRAMLRELVNLTQIGYWGNASDRALSDDASDRTAERVRSVQADKRRPLHEIRRERISRKRLTDPD